MIQRWSETDSSVFTYISWGIVGPCERIDYTEMFDTVSKDPTA